MLFTFIKTYLNVFKTLLQQLSILTSILLNCLFIKTTKLGLKKGNSYEFFYGVKDYENITPFSYVLFLVKINNL